MPTVVPEYVTIVHRMLGDEGAKVWLGNVYALLPSMSGMVRVALTPTWVGILDFEQRFPSALENAMAAMQATA